MNLCDNGHDEVCYAGNECPTCAEIKERDSTINDLIREVQPLKEDVGQLEDQLAELFEAAGPGVP